MDNVVGLLSAHPLLSSAKMRLVGSSFILGHGADIDVLILVKDNYPTVNSLRSEGWSMDGNYIGTRFTSLRKNAINLLITEDPEYYRAFASAADVCKYFVVADKAKRIDIHDLLTGAKTLDELKKEQ